MDDSVRISALETRVQALEDHIALYQSLSAYGPAVDSLDFESGISLWEAGGVYDLGDGFPLVDEGRGHVYLEGRGEILEMLNSEDSAVAFTAGCAHVMSVPLLKIDGDHAVGIGYHTMYVHTDDGAKLTRLNSSRIEWHRQESGGWQVTRRTHRLLDGRPGGRDLLRESLHEIVDAADSTSDRLGLPGQV